jgi:hypothetical protein
MGELVVEELEVGDEREILGPNRVDPDDHLLDGFADRRQIGVDVREFALRLGDRAAEIHLHGADLGDCSLLSLDLLGESVLAGAGVGELVGVDRRDGCGRRPETAEQERDEQDEGEPADQSRSRPPGRAAPAARRRVTAHQWGVIIVRANSVRRVFAFVKARVAVSPPVSPPPRNEHASRTTPA